MVLVWNGCLKLLFDGFSFAFWGFRHLFLLEVWCFLLSCVAKKAAAHSVLSAFLLVFWKVCWFFAVFYGLASDFFWWFLRKNVAHRAFLVLRRAMLSVFLWCNMWCRVFLMPCATFFCDFAIFLRFCDIFCVFCDDFCVFCGVWCAFAWGALGFALYVRVLAIFLRKRAKLVNIGIFVTMWLARAIYAEVFTDFPLFGIF